MDLQKLTEHVVLLSREVAAFIRLESRRFTEAEVESKGLNNLVSYVDKQAEARFVAGLNELLPEAGFIAEEGTGERAEGLNWVIDPLDGTTNFVHGMPCYCTSVALVRGGDVLLGVVLEVNRDECFAAWAGGGATLNGMPIRVSSRSQLQESLLATGFPYDDFGFEAEYMDLLRELMHRTRGIRRLGSAAADLAYVACGRFEAFYEYGLNSWDVAAGVILVREAGGQVSGFRPSKDPVFDEEIVASNSAIHAELLEVIERSWQRQDS
ncbi:MAG: inositol monophosphatase [Flavobacteriales bacterium]|nr:inositol monophosphatase [Flavobacteriales bacterium]MBP9078701.1 inositol monophosphatase [Flavobacteriales bacterium]